MTNSEKRRKRKAARHEPGKPPAKQPKFKAPFIKMLAVELQLAVLSYLSVKDIQKCRRINKYIRDLIDNPANQVICVEFHVVQGREKFDDFIKTHVEYDVNAVDANGIPCAFLDALVALTKSRGIARDICFSHSVWPKSFAKHWLERWYARAQSNMQLGRPDYNYLDVFSLITKLHMLHVMRQGLSVGYPFFRSIGMAEESIRRDRALELVGVTQGQCDAAFLQKVAAGAFEGTRLHEQDGYFDCLGCRSPYAIKLVGSVSQLGHIYHSPERRSERSKRLQEALRDGRSSQDFRDEESADAEKKRQREEASWATVSRNARGGASKAAREHAFVRDAVQDDTIEAGGRTADGSGGNTLSPPLPPGFPPVPPKEEDEVGQKLLEMFQLPKLPEGRPFAYYGRPRRMVHLLKEVMQGEKALTPLRKAAILDSIQIW
ncbi:hypothetical protein BST61_g11598 [Cercospora zeina]